jgi:hypothetical protein
MSEKPRSVPVKSRHFAVAASPFNLVKLELGILLVVAVVWAVLVSTFVEAAGTQLLLFVTYGIVAMGWLIGRTSRVLQAQASKSRAPGVED